MTMLVFAGKRVRSALLSDLIGLGEEIALVVVDAAADREILQLCSQARVACHRLDRCHSVPHKFVRTDAHPVSLECNSLWDTRG
jgi:hypothetical protein